MDAKLITAIARVTGAAERIHLEPILIGALACSVAPGRPEGLPLTRRTKDADFALAVGDWGAYDRLGEELLRAGFKRDPHIEHRFYVEDTMVDLVPFGPNITTPDGILLWPKSQFKMDVTGFEEACAASSGVEIARGVSVRCITIPAFALLKVCAFLDRQRKGDLKHRDDAQDLLYWFKHYASGDDDDRRYELVGSAASIDYLSAGAAVLGQDVWKLAGSRSRERVGDFIKQSSDPYGPFATALVRTSMGEEEEQRDRNTVMSLLAAFRLGYDEARDTS